MVRLEHLVPPTRYAATGLCRRAPFLLVLLPALGGALACESSPIVEPKSATAAPVRTTRITERSFTRTLKSFGQVQARHEVTLSVPFSGRVAEVYFREGEEVARGQALVRFDQRKQSLVLARAGSGVKEAHARLAAAKKSYARAQALASSGAVAGAQLDDARTAYRTAQSHLESARAQRSLARRSVAEGVLLAPIAGTVQLRAVEVGAAVLPGAPLGVVQDLQELRVKTWVSDRDVSLLRPGDRAVVRFADGQLQTEARLESIGAADARTGKFEIRIGLEQTRGLRPGMTVDVELQTSRLQSGLFVPRAAIVQRDRQRVVFRLENGVAKRVVPRFGVEEGTEVRVLAGLDVRDRVIVEGLESVTDGVRVQTRVVEVQQGG